MKKKILVALLLSFPVVVQAQRLQDIVGNYSIKLATWADTIIYHQQDSTFLKRHLRQKDQPMSAQLYQHEDSVFRMRRLTIRADSTFSLTYWTGPSAYRPSGVYVVRGRVDLLDKHVFLFYEYDLHYTRFEYPAGGPILRYQIVENRVELKTLKKNYDIYRKD